MPTADYSSYHQPPGTGGDGTKLDNFIDAVQATVNGLDNNNVAALAGIDVSKISAPYTAYTPTWASSGTAVSLGNGSVAGRYLQVGKVVFATIVWTAGSTTTFGTGSYSFTLPVTAKTSFMPAGTAIATDLGVAAYGGLARVSSTTTVDFFTLASPAANWTNTAPFTFGNGDSISASFTYEAA